MNVKNTILGLIASLLLTGSVFAHSPLKETEPSDGAVISDEQSAIQMTFGKKTRLIKVVLTKEGASEIRLNIPSKSFMEKFELEADIAEPGLYRVDWRALSQDGHPIKGSFGFTKEQN